MSILTGIPFLQARHFKAANRTRIGWIVIHSAEVGDVYNAAEVLMQRCAIKRVDAHGKEVVSSWNFAVDADSVTQSVRVEDVAYHAPGANAAGIGIELAARASQTAAQWDDAYSRSVLARAALLTAELCGRWDIPVAFVTSDGLLRGVRGVTTHAEVSAAFKRSSHVDPGANWPRDRFMDLVRQYRRQVA